MAKSKTKRPRVEDRSHRHQSSRIVWIAQTAGMHQFAPWTVRTGLTATSSKAKL